jgi:WhiB family redox-sensing transcriptional regulator
MADTRRLPGPNADIWDWQLEGNCRGMDSAFFFHPDGERGPARSRREARAKAICQACPVLAQCRTHAMTVQEPYGIWGGLGEIERRQLFLRQRRAARKTMSAH